ncbi:MAG: 2,4-diacetylphloroglucinol hydrolase [Gammaproteobacteria bacterium]|nr:MAG: 2,4-diacetylphloroglucinol hydrolase [Gammaproteobacteria bacterium]
MNRRELLYSGLAAGGLAASGGAAWSEAGPDADGLSPVQSAVTYMPVPAQKQVVANAEALGSKPYAGFFNPELTVSTRTAREIQAGPLAAEETTAPSIEGLASLLTMDHATLRNGYGLLENGTSYVQSRHLMPGVTTEMFRWWFTWHPVESERYMLWFPHAHIENSVEDPDRLADTSLSYEERLYDNPNHVKELIGPEMSDFIIHFKDPAELGFDPAAMRAAGFTASASGLISPTAAYGVITSLMVHIARDTAQGMELISRYWIGAHPELKRFKGAAMAGIALKLAGFDEEAAENAAHELAVHDMIEFEHLARLLPGLYARFADG